MRFLYGDSAPFPLGYNFLATLEVFMAAATRVVQLDHESRDLLRHTDEIAKNRLKGLEALDQFHTVVMRAVQETAQKVQHAHALDYAQRVAGFASSFVDDHRRTTLAANEREGMQSASENDRRVSEQRTHIEGFLKVARLPVLATKLSMRLSGEGKETSVNMTALFDNPDGIQTAFTLGAFRIPFWASPRKVSDFLQGIELMVGVDKSWLRGTVTAKQLNVDDWIVAQFETSEETFELTLRRKIAEKDSIMFTLRRTETGVLGRVQHTGPGAGEGVPDALSPGDVSQLERLWKAIMATARDVVDQKEQLLSVNLDGQPVFDARLAVPFVVRLVTMFAPTVREIAKRSPNEFELSLKQETEGGRREEIYLRKEQLLSKLQPLPSSGREVFAPLGLDTWVPGTTSVPPAVVTGSMGPPSGSAGPSSRRPPPGG